MELTQELLKRHIHYDKNTGEFTWIEKTSPYSNVAPGSKAGRINLQGYRTIRLFNKHHRAHRLAWLYEHGEWPDGPVDHINGNTSDNRISNLRSVSCLENSRNQKMNARNKSGVVGVSWEKRRGHWVAGIGVKGEYIRLGSFKELDAAAKARAEAEKKYDFHPNHGKR